jgi:hypothetical protein
MDRIVILISDKNLPNNSSEVWEIDLIYVVTTNKEVLKPIRI